MKESLTYYHGSPTDGLQELIPSASKYFNKPSRVSMTTLRTMALFYTARQFEYTYGYDKMGRIHFMEYFPNALNILYRGKSGFIYTCHPTEAVPTEIPNEYVSRFPVKTTEKIKIPDISLALLAEEKAGRLIILRYETLPAKTLEWITNMQTYIIRQNHLNKQNTPLAEYMRTNYPICWEKAAAKEEA